MISGVAAKSTDLFNNEKLRTVFSGHDLSVHLYGGLTINAEANFVNVLVTDMVGSNGVIHIVDAVLMPVYLSIVETAVAQPELTSLVGALKQANLVDALSADGPFTVFAPTNNALAAISSIVDGLSTEQLSNVLLAHVLSGKGDESPCVLQ